MYAQTVTSISGQKVGTEEAFPQELINIQHEQQLHM